MQYVLVKDPLCVGSLIDCITSDEDMASPTETIKFSGTPHSPEEAIIHNVMSYVILKLQCVRSIQMVLGLN